MIYFRRRSKLQRWVDQYLSDRPVLTHKFWLEQLAWECNKELVDITTEDLSDFVQKIVEQYNGDYSRQSSCKAVRCFLAYWRGRGHKYLPSQKVSLTN